MGYTGSSSIHVKSNGQILVRNMPAVWRNWNNPPILQYENVEGMVVVDGGDPQLTIEIYSINGENKKGSTFMGAEACSQPESDSIRIPYKGWDQDEYLVFQTKK